MATLLIFGGLPGTGKTTLARHVARRLNAVHLRIDTVEAAMVNSGIASVGPLGYCVAYALAEDNLRLGMTVIADSVNPLEITRQAWREVAERAEVDCVEIEVLCSDRDEHQHRIESRRARFIKTQNGTWQPPTWHDVASRDFEAWGTEHVVLDTAGQTAELSAARLETLLGIAP